MEILALKTCIKDKEFRNQDILKLLQLGASNFVSFVKLPGEN